MRLSQECEALLGSIGENQSAAIRALVLIGADAVGLDLGQVQPDLRRAVSDDLPASIATRLWLILEQMRTALQGSSIPSVEIVGAAHAISAGSRVTMGADQNHVSMPQITRKNVTHWPPSGSTSSDIIG